MPSGTFGHIEEFDEAKGEWPVYVERLEHYFEANAIDDERQK